MALHTPWLPFNRFCAPDSERSHRANIVMQQITDRINANLVEGRCLSDRDPEDITPWGLFFAYHICASHMRLPQSTRDTKKIVEVLKGTFLRIDARWNAAGIPQRPLRPVILLIGFVT